MSLFSFADIRFNNTQRTNAGSRDNMAPNSGSYQIHKYPIDLGDYNKGHYIIFYINEQLKTQFPGNTTGDLPSVYRNAYNSATEAAVNAPNFSLGNSDSQQFTTKFVRTIRRISDAIALYMPDSLLFSQQQNFNSIGMSQGGLSQGVAAAIAGGSSIVDALKSVGQANGGQADMAILKQLPPNIAPFVMGILAQNAGGIFQGAFTALTGVVQNPMMEVLYSAPSFREFQFDFMFYPRSEKEAEQVQKIIHRFRFHQAPEIDRQSKGFFFVPPSEFDIKFYYNGRENPNIQKVSTCVLHGVSVDYAPNGFAAYEVPGSLSPSLGRSGMPVAIRMTLSFKETEMITKAHLGREPDSGFMRAGSDQE